jgi:uncharacterized protein (DUF1778 family)
MPMISFRVSEDGKKLIEKCAKYERRRIADFVRMAIEDKIEDVEDIMDAEECELFNVESEETSLEDFIEELKLDV